MTPVPTIRIGIILPGTAKYDGMPSSTINAGLAMVAMASPEAMEHS
jgi:hypothetical protein